MNPYDINAFQSNVVPPLTFETGLSVNLPPIEQIHIPEIQSPDIDKHVLIAPKPKDAKELFADINKGLNSKPLYEFTYTQDKDRRYDNPNMRYNPTVDNEKLYENEQGQWGALKVQLGNAWNTLWNTYDNTYIGRGRTYSNLVNLEGYEKVKNSFLNSGEQQNAYLDNINYMLEHPIYNADTEDDSYFSMRGEFGNLIASSGYTAAGVVTTLQDTVVGGLLKAGTGTPAGRAVVAALGIGTTALMNKDVQGAVGEELANRLSGMMLGGTESGLISSGWAKLFKGESTLKKLADIRKAAQAAKQNKNVFKQVGNYFDDMLYNAKAGTVLDKASGLGKEMLLKNTLVKGGKLASTFGKMYISSGAEAGVEALDAQAQYLEQRLTLDKDIEKDEKYYQDLEANIKSVGQQTYDLNRALLAVTNLTQFKDIVIGKSIANMAERAGVEYIGKKFVAKGSVGKELLKTFVTDNLSEGVEEFGQLAISKGTVAHVLEKERGKSKIDSYFDETANLISPEGFKAFMSGMIMGSGISAVKGLFNASRAAVRGESVGKAVTGYDKEYSTQVANYLNQSANTFNTILTNSKKLDPKSTNIKEQVNEAIFDHAASSIQSGAYPALKDHLKSLFEAEKGSSDHELLLNAYGSDKAIEQAKTEIFSKLDQAKNSINNFTEYFDNPFTRDTIDGFFDKDKKGTKEKKDMFDTLVNTAARAMYIQEDKTEEFKKIVDQIKPAFQVTGNEVYDYSTFFTSNSAGWDTFKAQVNEDITTLNTANGITKLSLQERNKLKQLEKIQKDIASFEDEEKTVLAKPRPVQSGDTEMDKLKFTIESANYDLATKQANPIFRFIQQNNPNFDLRALKLLNQLQRTNEALALVTNDLDKLTTPKTQKQFVENLYKLRKTFVKGAELEKQQESTAIVTPQPQVTAPVATPTTPVVAPIVQPVVSTPQTDVDALGKIFSGIECD